MKVHFITITLNGMPFIRHHLPQFERLSFDWEWHVVEGVASPTGCTGWCRPMPFSFHKNFLSIDGTSQYLDSIQDKRVKVYRSRSGPWPGKLSMFNLVVSGIDFPAIIHEVDSDELWMAQDLETIYRMFIETGASEAKYRCRYYVGPDIVVSSVDTWGNRKNEWVRTFASTVPAKFKSHEPPVWPRGGVKLSHKFTSGLVFNHFAYATEQQVAQKEAYYGYSGAVSGWRKLQGCTSWPVRLSDYLPWAEDAEASRITKPVMGDFGL